MAPTARTAPLLDLRALFEIQEQSAERNFEESQFLAKVFSFLSESVALNLAFLQNRGFASNEKTTAVRMLAVDCISHLVVAARVALWGAVPQSVAVLRGALEGFAILEFVVSHEQYKSAMLEVNNGFNRVEYRAALHSMGRGAEKLWRRMSNLGAHASAKRVRSGEYSYEGEKCDRLGCAIDPAGATAVTFLAASLSMRITESLRKAADQENLVFPMPHEYKTMTERFDALREGFSDKERARDGHS